MLLVVELGEHRCSATSASSAGNDETLCAIVDGGGKQALPPVNISVNFGDGTGEQLWTREDPRDLWTHVYQLPGHFTVSVFVINEYDFTYDSAWLDVEVVDPVYDNMGIEVVCPPVVTPGEYFVCTADIPRGSDLIFSLDMTDDLNSTLKTESGWLSAPDPFLHIAGGPLKSLSWNKTKEHLLDPATPTDTDNYILRSTQFSYQANLTGIEYVAATKGTFLVDILKPSCPPRLDPVTKEILEEVFWCPITGACESNCYSELQMAKDWETEWGAEWLCRGNDFCSLEGMCNWPDACALSPSGEFGGISILPHAPKNITDLSDNIETAGNVAYAAWRYKINQTFEITVLEADLWKPQFFEIVKEYYYDPEREQDRKNHIERQVHLILRILQNSFSGPLETTSCWASDVRTLERAPPSPRSTYSSTSCGSPFLGARKLLFH